MSKDSDNWDDFSFGEEVPDPAIAETSQVGIPQGLQRLPGDVHLAPGRPVDAAEQVEQRGLA